MTINRGDIAKMKGGKKAKNQRGKYMQLEQGPPSQREIQLSRRKMLAAEELAHLMNNGKITIRFAHEMSARQRKKYALEKKAEA